MVTHIGRLMRPTLALLAALPWPVYVGQARAAARADASGAYVDATVADAAAAMLPLTAERKPAGPADRSIVDATAAMPPTAAPWSRLRSPDATEAGSAAHAGAARPTCATLCRYLI